MGHLINPVSLRLGINKFWINSINTKNLNNNNKEVFGKRNVDMFLERFFLFKFFLKNGFLYSHNNLNVFKNKIHLNIYLYKTIKTVNLKYKYNILLLLLKKFHYKIKKILYNKVLLLINHFFYLNKKNNKFLLITKNIKNYYKLVYLIQKKRFFVIQKYIELIINKIMSMVNGETNNFFNLLFKHYQRKNFWYLINNFLNFYLQSYYSSQIQFNIYILPNITIDIIKSYILIRSRQRFKVSQIMNPIIKDLKANKNILGFKFLFSGRFSRREMATSEWFIHGSVPLNTFNSAVEYRQLNILLKDSTCGVKIWLNRSLIPLTSKINLNTCLNFNAEKIN